MVLLIGACSKEKEILGTYQAVPDSPPRFAGLLVELKKGGEGIRRIKNGEALAFQWVIKGGEIRIHTRYGGIIVARPKGDLYEVIFPGPQIVYFKKIK
ncbi:MAG: hypothetical protein ABSE95_08145 [Thermodesulfobacteriota bacterium]